MDLYPTPGLSPEAAHLFDRLEAKQEEVHALHWRALTAESLLRMILTDYRNGAARLQPHRLAQLEACMENPEAYAQKKHEDAFGTPLPKLNEA